MRPALLLSLSLAAAALACHSTSAPAADSGQPAQREALLAAVSGLAGRWEAPSEDAEPVVHEFSVGSGGSAVREIMFPGTPHEMTNMYTLDGDALVMTHYCAMGNQPHMRATSIEGDRIVFRADGVSDLSSPDEAYMGEMTLVMVHDDHIEQQWRAFRAGELDHELKIPMTRVR